MPMPAPLLHAVHFQGGLSGGADTSSGAACDTPIPTAHCMARQLGSDTHTHTWLGAQWLGWGSQQHSTSAACCTPSASVAWACICIRRARMTTGRSRHLCAGWQLLCGRHLGLSKWPTVACNTLGVGLSHGGDAASDRGAQVGPRGEHSPPWWEWCSGWAGGWRRCCCCCCWLHGGAGGGAVGWCNS